jgi:hypothetical protein
MLSTIKPIRASPGLNPGLGSEKLVTRSETFQYAGKEGSRRIWTEFQKVKFGWLHMKYVVLCGF